MSITFCDKQKIFKIDNSKSSYVFKISDEGYLIHLYYGNYLKDINLEYLDTRPFVNFAPVSPYGEIMLDSANFEYSNNGIGDFRSPSISVLDIDGNNATNFRYKNHKIYNGKYELNGLPSTYDENTNVETLEITLYDEKTDLYLTILYSTFIDIGAITRAVKIKNNSITTVNIEKISSFCIDFKDCNYDYINLYGSWGNERNLSRNKLGNCKHCISSNRGTSSHQQNPFLSLVRPNTDENIGEAYGFNLVYSGNFLGEIEVDQKNTTRVQMGINPETFNWELEPQNEFFAPEVVMVYSSNGIGDMSRTFHNLYRNNLCRGYWKDRKRPILINNWEATYFDFNEDEIFSIAQSAKNLGIEMFVMDDGWFGKRDNDMCSLGDWVVNLNKIPSGLNELVKKINDIGLEFGIWFEPEMISPNSDLYKYHPEWCLQIPNRKSSLSRHQLVLDMSRQDVIDYLFESLSKILNSANIIYVKWDMNRHLSEVGSLNLAKNKQKEIYHRYVLGVYQLMERLVNKFPKLLIENCSGGGGRFDAGMLYYSPQIWTSDTSDSFKRVEIQYGTSICYPVSTMGAHVSACPNHQTGRSASLDARGLVAMSGTFGYELNIDKLTEEEHEIIKKQIQDYNNYYNIINYGDYYRINSVQNEQACWAFISKDKKEILLNFISLKGQPYPVYNLIKLIGADKNKKYLDAENEKIYFGDTLINAGLLVVIPQCCGDGYIYQCYLKEIQ